LALLSNCPAPGKSGSKWRQASTLNGQFGRKNSFINQRLEENSMQTLQADYFAAYRHLKLSRDGKGVLLAEFHSNGGPYIMNAQGHTEFGDAFHRIGQDRANKIVILTGAGGNFIGDVEWPSFGGCRRSRRLE
jgi:hypothetical protein